MLRGENQGWSYMHLSHQRELLRLLDPGWTDIYLGVNVEMKGQALDIGLDLDQDFMARAALLQS